MDSVPQKRCTKCGEEFPATTEFWHKAKNGKLGLAARCKSCSSSYYYARQEEYKAENRARYYLNKEERLAKARDKYASDPEYRAKVRARNKRYDNAHREELNAAARVRLLFKPRKKTNAERERDRQRARKHWDKNKDEYNAKRREDRKYYPDVYKHQNKRYRDANTEHIKQRKRNDYVQNRDKILEQQKASAKRRAPKIKEYHRKHYLLNKEEIVARSRTHKNKRRAIEKELGVQFTAQNWRDCLAYWDYKCAICGQSETMWVTLAQDHWIAITDKRSDNPGTVIWNILPLCHARKGIPIGTTCCNQSKGKKDPIEWLNEQLGKRKAKRKLAEIKDYFESVKPK
jgi:hypothetical protein